MGGRQCALCGGAFFSSRHVPPCSGGQQCPRAFGHRRGSVTWIDGRWVAVDLFEEILRWRNTGRRLSASSQAGDVGGEVIRAAMQRFLDTPLPDEPSFAAEEPTPRPPIRGVVQEALLAKQSRRAGGPPKPPSADAVTGRCCQPAEAPSAAAATGRRQQARLEGGLWTLLEG